MTIENLGAGNGVNENGDVVPLYELGDDQFHIPPSNEKIIARAEAERRLDGRDIVSLGVAAAIAMERQQVEYPRKIEDVIRERQVNTRVQPDREDAYASLGGGIPSHRESEVKAPPLDNVIEEYEPWKHDIRQAVEQFGVADFTASELSGMKDFKAYSLHFYRYLDGISTSIRLIEQVNGETRIDQDLRAKYGEQNSVNALEYARTLKWLKRDLEATGIPRAARNALGLDIDGEVSQAQRIKTLDAFREDRKHHKVKNVRVRRNKGKLEIERTNEAFNK